MEKLRDYKNRPKKNNKQKKLLRYKLRLTLVYSTIFFAVSFTCLFASSLVLFRIKEIIIKGDKVCEDQILIEKSGIKIGNNLFFENVDTAISNLEKSILDIDRAYIEKKYPNKLIIDIKKAKKFFCIEYGEKYIYVSENGKVLEVSNEKDQNLMFLKGIELNSFDLGEKIVYSNKIIEKTLYEFLEKMNLNNLPNISEINFNNGTTFLVNYENRIKINFGFFENIDYKIKVASEIINNKLGNMESGELDLSDCVDENRSYFTPSYS